MFFMRILMLVFGMLRSASLLMDCLCIAPLTLVVIVMRGFVFQPLFRIVFISGLYLACFCVMDVFLINIMWSHYDLTYGDHPFDIHTHGPQRNHPCGIWVKLPTFAMWYKVAVDKSNNQMLLCREAPLTRQPPPP